ncbi:hypothetical protein D9M73_95680 [compost metagenome]
MLNQPSQVDRPEQACTIGWQHLLAAWVARRDPFAMRQIVARVCPINEDHSGLGTIIGRAHQALPERPCRYASDQLSAERQRPFRIRLECRHERIGHQHRQVEIAEAQGIALGVDERLDIGMVDAQASHHRTAPLAGGQDGAAHGIPAIHEGQRPRCVRRDSLHGTSARPDGGEIHTYPAALLHRQRSFAQLGEDIGQAVLDRIHDEAVEQRDAAPGPGPGQDPPGRNQPEIGECLRELALPMRPLARRFGFSHGGRYPGDRVGIAPVVRMPIFGGPYLAGKRGVEFHCPYFLDHAHAYPPSCAR